MGESCAEKFILLGRSKFSRVMDCLDSQRRDGRFCDVILKLDEDSSLAVHASVLSACSSYINDLVSLDLPRKFCEENPQIIELTIVPSENMHYDTLFINLLQLVEYFYGRNLSINRKNCYNICALASFFQAEDIVRQCEEFISNRLTNDSDDELGRAIIKVETPGVGNKGEDDHNEEMSTGKSTKRSGEVLHSFSKRKNNEVSDNQDSVDMPSISNVGTLPKSGFKHLKGQQALRLKGKAKQFSVRKQGRPRSSIEDPPGISYEDWEQEDGEAQKCKKCNFVTKSSLVLRNHTLTHYGRPYICRSCGYRVKQPALMVKHLLDSKDCPEHQSDTICSVCEEEMSSNEVLHEHFKLHDHQKPFMCSICELRLPHKSALFLHKTKHVDDRMFICGTCGRTFKTKYSLQNHMIIHETEKNYLCDECGYITKYKASLEAHNLLHTGQTLKCKHPGCSFEAIRTSNLNDHMLSHSKDRPFVCEICGLAFNRVKHLRRHSFLHGGTSLPGYGCPLCDFTSHRSDKVKVHMKKQHPDHEDAKITNTIVTSPQTLSSAYNPGMEDVQYQVVSAELLLQQALNTITSVHKSSYLGPVPATIEYENIENVFKIATAHEQLPSCP